MCLHAGSQRTTTATAASVGGASVRVSVAGAQTCVNDNLPTLRFAAPAACNMPATVDTATVEYKLTAPLRFASAEAAQATVLRLRRESVVSVKVNGHAAPTMTLGDYLYLKAIATVASGGAVAVELSVYGRSYVQVDFALAKAGTSALQWANLTWADAAALTGHAAAAIHTAAAAAVNTQATCDALTTCNGGGSCTGTGTCSCYSGYGGDNCQCNPTVCRGIVRLGSVVPTP